MDSMSMASIKAKMAYIRDLKRTDVTTAREEWKALKDRVEGHCQANKLPDMWKKCLLDVLKEI